ncbi:MULTISPECIES: hydrogen peroxide-inducible genes activator [unclassified Novosphingobium]|uniref:hydrogen peroxide-inducible genes activator n=1 Tax=unclassified Novosphingobium TaxID=2644732 RepID=UPI0014428F56|nr:MULTISPECIES: hydrogen peroxide-inducible genes activator [unclassified Novosphingobium]MBB3356511.1 LysR family hydrogen peroxide-inducible transcriptional activator [Novosphingobium sp. BK256]MBB3372912.1 LysR family hydrogen peroxide-inducible transcriptional activator [Novosphingobium sp. BK280]MBB3377280.1 LysR family hydrogen peroxide-inducible transcriptional activator [Novosphingobium sp. BK258]MBB3419309.1 LysR family hydrogen peroxide-inducible transcriptional activator [Novosphing
MTESLAWPSLRQLRCLVALADCGNFTRGAAAMGVSQPSFSQQIHLLEGLLGGAVAERGGRMVLTPLGREAVAAARRVLTEAEGFADLARRHRQGELAGTLRLGVSPTLGPYILPQLVARLHATHPDLKVHVREGLPDALLDHLGDGRHDTVLLQLPVTDARFHIERLFREPMFLAMAADDPMAAVRVVRPEHLAGRGLLTMQPEYRLSQQVAALAERCGAQVLRDYEGTSLDAVRQMAGMGMGLALLPELYVRQEIAEGGDVVVRPFAGGRPYREIGLIWRIGAGRSGDLMLLAETLRSIAQR